MSNDFFFPVVNTQGRSVMAKGYAVLDAGKRGPFQIGLMTTQNEQVRGTPNLVQLCFGDRGLLTTASIAPHSLPVNSLTMYAGNETIKIAVSSIRDGVIQCAVLENNLVTKTVKVYALAF